MCFESAEFISREYGRINYTVFRSASAFGTNVFEAFGSYGRIIHHEVRDDAYSLWHSRYILNQDMHLAVVSDQPTLSLNYILKNAISLRLEGISEDTFQEQQFNMIYIPTTKCEYAFRGEREYVFFGIHYQYRYLDRWKNQFPFLADFLEKAEKGVPVIINSTQHVFTPEMKAMIWDIHQNMGTLPLRKIHMEVKSLELLTASLEQLSINKTGSDRQLLSDEDASNIQRAREYLLAHLDQQVTLKSLAREVGTNTFKLKTGFKQLHKVTVFEFLREERMQRARKMILESHEPVYKVASAVGYLNPANFATSFKKRFGYPPSKLRS